jgi:undecaprenyl pyrophosphate synthase
MDRIEKLETKVAELEKIIESIQKRLFLYQNRQSDCDLFIRAGDTKCLDVHY